MKVDRVPPHFLDRWTDRAEYPITDEQEALRVWNAASPLPSEPFDIEGRARYWADANAILVADLDALVTVLTPAHAIERCAGDQQ
jgi:hypothetical protein